MAKTAIIFFNLGGPDRLDAVQPFLFNLFFDRAIIDLPLIPRWLLARRISSKRAPTARSIYLKLGGKSPLVEETQAQALALQGRLGPDYNVFIAMRYWHPMTAQAVRDVKEWGADRVVLLPLYPHYSLASTGSSLDLWRRQAKSQGLDLPTATVCCYPDHPQWIKAVAELTMKRWEKLREAGHNPRVLFSAHGLPQSLIDKGDPYQAQIEACVAAVADRLELDADDWRICYLSRLGKQIWIGPPIDEELANAAHEARSVVVVPISFVSEHSETLVELDIEYREIAAKMGVPAYERVPTVGCHDDFIDGLAQMVRENHCSKACDRLGKTCPDRQR
jgi:ferrochelatase